MDAWRLTPSVQLFKTVKNDKHPNREFQDTRMMTTGTTTHKDVEAYLRLMYYLDQQQLQQHLLKKQAEEHGVGCESGNVGMLLSEEEIKMKVSQRCGPEAQLGSTAHTDPNHSQASFETYETCHQHSCHEEDRACHGSGLSNHSSCSQGAQSCNAESSKQAEYAHPACHGRKLSKPMRDLTSELVERCRSLGARETFLIGSMASQERPLSPSSSHASAALPCSPCSAPRLTQDRNPASVTHWLQRRATGDVGSPLRPTTERKNGRQVRSAGPGALRVARDPAANMRWAGGSVSNLSSKSFANGGSAAGRPGLGSMSVREQLQTYMREVSGSSIFGPGSDIPTTSLEARLGMVSAHRRRTSLFMNEGTRPGTARF